MELGTKFWIILGIVLGVLILCVVSVVVLVCWRRNTRRIRGFSLRAVTPLDDAEFESWRRPSQYTQRPEKHGIRPVQPTVTRDRISSTMTEKELDDYEPIRSQTPDNLLPVLQSPTTSIPLPQSPSSSIRKPERARRKSSVASSLADRPPTPYSPASVSSEFQRVSISSPRSPLLVHYPSMSEASAFHFEFQQGDGTHQQKHGGWISE